MSYDLYDAVLAASAAVLVLSILSVIRTKRGWLHYFLNIARVAAFVALLWVAYKAFFRSTSLFTLLP